MMPGHAIARENDGSRDSATPERNNTRSAGCTSRRSYVAAERTELGVVPTPLLLCEPDKQRMMGYYHKVGVELNNIGVKLLHAQRPLLASMTFQEGVKVLKEGIRMCATSGESTDWDDEGATHYPFPVGNDPRIRIAKERLRTPPEQVPLQMIDETSSSGILLYKRPMLIDQPRSNTQDAATMTYNMALANHMNGSFNAALELYDATYFVIVDLVIENDTNIAHDSALQMAILNNMGRLCFEMWEMEEALQCFDELRAQLDYRASVDEPVQWDGFLANVWFVFGPPSAAPSA